MWPSRPSWAAGILSFSLAVLAASVALNLAAGYLRQALPVLIPTAGAVFVGVGLWRFHNRPRNW